LALLCSAKAQASILLAVPDLAQQWRASGVPIISGFHSPMEQKALTILLRELGSAILCPAKETAVYRNRFAAALAIESFATAADTQATSVAAPELRRGHE
jgi:hypothetical protein